MKGNQPGLRDHLEMHAALVSEAGVGAFVPRQAVSAYIMRATGVGTRQSVMRHLEAWEDLGLVVWHRGKPGVGGDAGGVTLQAAPDGLVLPQLEAVPA